MDITQQNIGARGVRFSVLQDGKEVGRAFLYILSNDLHKEPFGIMEDVFVEESVRGQGIGTQLIEAVVAAAKKEGCYKLIATSRESRPRVHDLYLRLGFHSYGKEFRIDLL